MNKQIIVIFFFFFPFSALGQSLDKPIPDQLTFAKSKSMEVYSEFMGTGSHLSNGTEYKKYYQIGDEHPYLYLLWTRGVIEYDDHLYENVPLLYDLSSDEIVTLHFSGKAIQLIKQKVSYFLLQESKFVRLEDPKMDFGFYEILYDGRTKVYLKREKELLEKISDLEIHHEFKEMTNYFFYENGSYHLVKNKKSFLEIFPDRASGLKKFIREEKLSFKSSKKKSSLVRLAEFCDQLP